MAASADIPAGLPHLTPVLIITINDGTFANTKPLQLLIFHKETASFIILSRTYQWILFSVTTPIFCQANLPDPHKSNTSQQPSLHV
jgi:hypothetical protein